MRDVKFWKPFSLNDDDVQFRVIYTKANFDFVKLDRPIKINLFPKVKSNTPLSKIPLDTEFYILKSVKRLLPIKMKIVYDYSLLKWFEGDYMTEIHFNGDFSKAVKSSISKSDRDRLCKGTDELSGLFRLIIADSIGSLKIKNFYNLYLKDHCKIETDPKKVGKIFSITM